MLKRPSLPEPRQLESSSHRMNGQKSVNFAEHFLSHLFPSAISTGAINPKFKFPTPLPQVIQVVLVLEVDRQPGCFGRDLFNQDVEHSFPRWGPLLMLSDCINLFLPWALILHPSNLLKRQERIHPIAFCSDILPQPLTYSLHCVLVRELIQLSVFLGTDSTERNLICSVPPKGSWSSRSENDWILFQLSTQ